MYELLSQFKAQVPHHSLVFDDTVTATIVQPEFLSEAVFAGGSFWYLEAAFGRVDGVIKTATGYCRGTWEKPTYREVREGRTGHTEAAKVIFDNRRLSYRFFCDIFWDTHDPTNKDYLNFFLSTHYRSAIFDYNEEERKQAHQSKIRRQMKLNKRIVTKIVLLDSTFYMAENQNQKYYLQKRYRVCESLSLRSTEQFVESNIACKLNGILAMDGKMIFDKLTAFLETNVLPKQTQSACAEITDDVSKN